MTNLSLPLGIIAAHFIGDFLLQSDWMALNKSKFTPALTLHVTVYALTMFLAFLFYLDPIWAFGAFLYTWWSHFLTDAVTSRITSRLFFFRRRDFTGLPAAASDDWYYVKGLRHWFFVVIGLDQLIHYVTLALTFNFIHSLP